MSEKYKTFEGNAYYVTLTVAGWIDVFTRKDYVYELMKNMKYCQENKGLELYAYVIMPNHLHWIARAEEGRLSDILRDFKSYTAKVLMEMVETHQQESRREWLMYMFRYFGKHNSQNKELQFWQQHNHPIELYSEKVKQKITYLHDNPVRAGFVAKPYHWLYSSANPGSEIKVLNVGLLGY